MRKNLTRIKLVILCGLVMLPACAPKPRDAIKAADQALAQAEEAGAPAKRPELYQSAQEHYREGRQQLNYFRYNLARCEYEAAAEQARIAAIYSQEEGEAGACPPCPESGVGLDLCNNRVRELEDDNARLTRQLDSCDTRVVVKTRVVEGECRETEDRDDADQGDSCFLMGTLVVRPPEPMTADKNDYQIPVSYEPAKLGEEGRLDDRYRILLDIVDVIPDSAEALSPMMDFEPLPGEWAITVRTPESLTKPVKVKVGATLWIAGTDKMQNLPPVTVTIDKSAFKGMPVSPEKDEKPAVETKAKEKGGSDWLMWIVMTVVGLLVGLGVGFGIFRKKGP